MCYVISSLWPVHKVFQISIGSHYTASSHRTAEVQQNVSSSIFLVFHVPHRLKCLVMYVVVRSPVWYNLALEIEHLVSFKGHVRILLLK